MKLKLPTGYEKDLEDSFLSKDTVATHIHKHHAGYVKKANNYLMNEDFSFSDLKSLIQGAGSKRYDLLAQAWNHTFYFKGIATGEAHKRVSAALKDAVKTNFSSMDQLKDEFIEKSKAHFGSGWSWIVKDKEHKLKVVTTPNADIPFYNLDVPILTCDLWEHAFYIDYRNDKLSYLEDFWKNINWQYVSENYESRELRALEDELVER